MNRRSFLASFLPSGDFVTTSSIQSGIVSINFRLCETNEEAASECKARGLSGAMGCAFGPAQVVGLGEMYTVICRRPRDFNDLKAMEILGHEVAHCLGGRHL